MFDVRVFWDMATYVWVLLAKDGSIQMRPGSPIVFSSLVFLSLRPDKIWKRGVNWVVMVFDLYLSSFLGTSDFDSPVLTWVIGVSRYWPCFGHMD